MTASVALLWLTRSSPATSAAASMENSPANTESRRSTTRSRSPRLSWLQSSMLLKVWCRVAAVRRPLVRMPKRSSSRAASSAMPNVPTRDAAISIASGKPSSRRQISTMNGTSASPIVNASSLASMCETKSSTAGRSRASRSGSASAPGGSSNGASRNTRSPSMRSGSWLVATMLMPGQPLRMASVTCAAVSITCSQLSNTSSASSRVRWATRLCAGRSVSMAIRSAEATANGRLSGDDTAARSMK